jgi:hypothetical protein
LHWVLKKVWKRDVKLHPDELTHVRSKKQVQEYLKQSGFTLEEFYFGVRDLFTQAVIVGLKPAVVLDDPAQPQDSQRVTTAAAAPPSRR